MKKRQLPESVKRKISLSQRGKKNSFYGKKHKKSAIEKISKATQGKNNPMFGKKHSEATKRKISLARKRAIALAKRR
jgi:hypothetical protein